MLDSSPLPKSSLFKILHDDLSGELGGYINKLTAGRTIDTRDREDIEQTVWLKVWNSLDHVALRPGHGLHNGLRSWVFTIARNTFIDLLKKARYRRHLSLEPDGTIRIDNDTVIEPPFEASSATDPYERLVGSETACLLQAGLQTLPAYQSNAIVGNMRGYDSIDMARLTGKSAGSIRQAWMRGRRHLATILAEQEPAND